MKVIILFVLLFATPILAICQATWTNKNVEVAVMKNTTVSIRGSLVCASTFLTTDFRNTGRIEITQDLTAQGTNEVFLDNIKDAGKVIFNGSTAQRITGTGKLTFENLEIKKPAGSLVLERDIKVSDSLIMTKGNIFLNGKHIELTKLALPNLHFESETSKIEDSLGGYISIRSQKNSLTLSDNILGLRLDAPSLSLGIEVRRYHYYDTSVSSNSIRRVYEVATVPNDKINTISMSYFETELRSISESELTLFTRLESQLWEKDASAVINAQANNATSSQLIKSGKLLITLSTKSCAATTLGFVKGVIDKCQFDSLVIAPSIYYKLYQWSNGATAPAITVKQSNTYKLLATDAKGCIATDSVIVKFNTLPVADFRPSVACGSKEVMFFNLSKSPSRLSYLWDLGANNQSVETSPTYVYDSLIVYKVSLIAIDTLGCSDTLIKNVDVKQSLIPLKAEFLFASKVFAQDTIKFVHLTQPEPRAFEWSFGDGSAVDSSYSPNHIFETLGIFTIRLSAANNGCSDVLVKTIEVLKNDKLRDQVISADKDLFIALDADVFPSPANKQIFINLKSSDKKFPVLMNVYNSKGQEIWKENSGHVGSTELSVENWSEGIYMVSILQNEKALLKKFLVRR